MLKKHIQNIFQAPFVFNFIQCSFNNQTESISFSKDLSGLWIWSWWRSWSYVPAPSVGFASLSATVAFVNSNCQGRQRLDCMWCATITMATTGTGTLAASYRAWCTAFQHAVPCHESHQVVVNPNGFMADVTCGKWACEISCMQTDAPRSEFRIFGAHFCRPTATLCVTSSRGLGVCCLWM